MNSKLKKHCINCGASYSYQEAKCPYCGTVNEIGAEQKYMEHLEDIREDLEAVAELPENVYKEEIKSTGKKVRKHVVRGIIVLAVIAAIWLYLQNRVYDYYSKDQLLWEQENLPKMDAWYEAGEYDKIQDFMNTAEYPLYDWEHYDYLESYRKHQSILYYHQLLQNSEELLEQDREFAIYDSLSLMHDATFQDSYQHFSEEEKQLIKEYGAEAEQLLVEAFGLTEQQVEEIYQAVLVNGYIDFEKCRKYIKKID